MVEKIEILGNYLMINGKRLALLSGEFHYWRNSKVWWPQIFQTIRDGGFGMIASYVCWDFHELGPSKYDFTGETSPQRDLDGFLADCEKRKFYVIIRPGPYIYSEWKNLGVPDHATAYHRLHPRFLEKARDYINAVSRVIKPHQITHGGSVVLLQVDNEVNMNAQKYTPSLGYGLDSTTSEYYKQIVPGSIQEPYTFRWWLKKKYGFVDKLNKAYDTSCRSFEEVEPFTQFPTTRYEIKRVFDENEFYEWYTTEYITQIKKMYLGAGIDVPLVTNTYSTPQPMNIPNIQEVVDLVGGDYYISDELNEEELLRLSLHIKHLRASTRIPWSLEFQAGTWSQLHYKFGVITPQHHRYMALLAMLMGLKGWNWYMLVNRDNWNYSPITERGEPREELYSHFKFLVNIFNELDWPSFQKNTNTTLIWYRPHYWLSKNTEAFVHDLAMRNTSWFTLFKSLHDCDIDFEIYDPHIKCLDVDNSPLMLYGGFEFMDEKSQEKLVKYVENGGNLAFLTPPPYEDLDGSKAIFSDLLPLAKFNVGWDGELMFSYGNKKYLTATTSIQRYDLDNHPEARRIVALGDNCGYVLPHGRGNFIALGFDPTHAVLEFIHREAGATIPTRSETQGILTSALTREGEIVLIILNTTLEKKQAKVKINVESLGIQKDKRYELTDLMARTKKIMVGSTLETLTVALNRKDGKILRLKPVA